MGESALAAAAVKDLVIAAGVVALSLGLLAAVVFGLDDQDTFVSPPEIVAEEFLRALGHGRIEPARSMLASDTEGATSVAELQRTSASFRSRVGRLDDVKATVAERKRDTAVVRAHVKGSQANAELMLPLVREHGLWSVARISAMLGAVDTATAPRATHP